MRLQCDETADKNPDPFTNITPSTVKYRQQTACFINCNVLQSIVVGLAVLDVAAVPKRQPISSSSFIIPSVGRQPHVAQCCRVKLHNHFALCGCIVMRPVGEQRNSFTDVISSTVRRRQPSVCFINCTKVAIKPLAWRHWFWHRFAAVNVSIDHRSLPPTSALSRM